MGSASNSAVKEEEAVPKVAAEQSFGGDEIWMVGSDDIMLDIDGEDFIFSDDAFASLPDFPCFSSPAASPSPSSASNCVKNPYPPSSSSSSSSSSSCSFLIVPRGGSANMQQPAVVPAPADDRYQQQSADSDGLDILGDIDLLDPGLWESSASFNYDQMVVADAVAPAEEPQQLAQEEGLASGTGGGGGAKPAESPSEDLAKVFLEWLKSNKDSISPEDLRSIKLKRSTIECAAQRLGGGRQGMTKLLKLILAWVQNHHLNKNSRQLDGGGGSGSGIGEQELGDRDGGSQFPTYRQPLPPVQQHHHHRHLDHVQANPNPSLDYNYDAAESSFMACGPWSPSPSYTIDPTTGAAIPYTDPNAAAPYHFMAANQPFSSAPDFCGIDAAPAWQPHYSAPVHYAPYLAGTWKAHQPLPQYPAGGFAGPYPVQPLYQQQSPRMTKMTSATKEARKKRMARQRRFSSAHHHRSHKQHHQDQVTSPTVQHLATSVELGGSGEGSRCAASIHMNSRNWSFWSAKQANALPDASPVPANPSSSNMSMQKQPNGQRNSASSDKRQQGWKVEKNLRFLLQKVLKQSDVGSLGRIVLPKKEAEIHLPGLDARDGISIAMEDIGTSRVWNMRYRFWPNNKSRMYLLENTGDFVRSNGLQEGDFIVIYSDMKCGKYMIRGVKVRQPSEPKGLNGKNMVVQKKNGSEKYIAFKAKSTSSSNRGNEDSTERPPSSSGEAGDDSTSTTEMFIITP